MLEFVVAGAAVVVANGPPLLPKSLPAEKKPEKKPPLLPPLLPKLLPAEKRAKYSCGAAVVPGLKKDTLVK